MQNGSRYVVLGGGGSFGLHTSKYILDNLDPSLVVGIGRSAPKAECFTLNVGKEDNRYRYYPYHITYEHDLLMNLLDKIRPQYIINFAAQGEGATSFNHSWRYFETNCVGLSRLVEELKKRFYLERFIHIGTSELYGPAIFGPVDETAPMKATSPYAASKAAFDMYLLSVCNRMDFPGIIVRPSNAYGEGQQLHRVIPKAVLLGLTGRKLPLEGGGWAEKSYIHNEDLARAIVSLLPSKPGMVYNVGPKEPTRIRDVVAMIAKKMNLGFEELCTVTADRQHQDSKYWLDSNLIKVTSGWEPKITLDEGLDRMIAWGRKYVDQLKQLPTDFVMRA